MPKIPAEEFESLERLNIMQASLQVVQAEIMGFCETVDAPPEPDDR